MVVAIASGKGGTGKTTLAVNLSFVAPKPVEILDCDVEEPNVRLFVHGNPVNRRTVSVMVPSVNEDKCTGCGECGEFCQFRALAVIGKTVMVFPELCHSCGGCELICPEKAISGVERPVGEIEVIQVDGNLRVVTGSLFVGVATPGPLIRAVKASAGKNSPLTFIDCPPGTSCPVVEAMKGADVAVIVTEPTPFGLHDLTLAVETVRALGIPLGVVINKAEAGYKRIYEFLEKECIPLLGEIPEDRSIAEAYARGKLIASCMPEYRAKMEEILENLIQLNR